MSIIQFETGIQIDRPIEQVFAFVADPANLPHWQPQIVEVRPLAGEELGPGSTFAVVGEMLGRRMEGSMEILEFEPPNRLVHRIDAGPMTVQAAFSLEPIATGTDLILSVRGEPSGILKWAAGPLEKQVRKQMEANLAALKATMEASP
jgi:uncharacterized protein YndB with AHSA1/START domain